MIAKRAAPKRKAASSQEHNNDDGKERESRRAPRTAHRTWIVYDPASGHDSKQVRRHAAAASAAARKQTIERKKAAKAAAAGEGPAGERQLVQQYLTAPAPAKEEAALAILRRLSNASSGEGRGGPGIAQLVDFVSVLQEGQDWYAGGGLRDTSSLAQKAVRTLLWDAYSNIGTLFQAALFISGTHSNSCGLSPEVTAHMGSGLLVLKGASLEAVQAAAFASDDESSTPVAIALLAGWERRFGDRGSYEVHMRAWQSLSLPPKALEDNHVSTLTDVTLEIFREKLDERSFVSPRGIEVGAKPSSIAGVGYLPVGFKVFSTSRPEARSLLMLVTALQNYDANNPATISARRKLGMEIIAWSPTHTISCEAVPSAEAQYDQLELAALYHVRAALISLNGVHLQLCMDTHNVKSTFDMQLGLNVHCMSCQHLNTEALLDTKYAEVAFWTRFALCSLTRDVERDAFLRRLLRHLGLSSWEQVKIVLEKHMDLAPVFGDKCCALYCLLTEPSSELQEDYTTQ